MDDGHFFEFLAAVRRGDQQAAGELVRRYEPYLRRILHLRLAGQSLRRAVDSSDICQSVLADFFRLSAEGRFRISGDADLKKLLVTMALNRLRTYARRERRESAALETFSRLMDDDAADARLVSEEFLELVRSRLTPEEMDLFHQKKVLRRSWAEIAKDAGRSPDALRMQLTRAIVRVQQELKRER